MSNTYIVITDIVAANTPSIAGDLYDGNANTGLNSVTQGKPFTIDVRFTLQQETTTQSGEGGETTTSTTNLEIQEVTGQLAGYGNVSFSVVNNSTNNYILRITGPVVGVIAGDTYDIVLRPDPPTSNIFPTITVFGGAPPEDYLAIYNWNPATVFWTLLPNNYVFTVNPDTENQTKTLSQYVYWGWLDALAAFRLTVENGEI